MLWFIAAIIATLARTGTYTLNKNLLKNISPLTLATSTSLFVCILCSPVFLLSVSQNPVITTHNLAYLGVAAASFLNSFAFIILMKALKSGYMSIVVPLRNLVPVFVLVWGVIFLNEPVTVALVLATFLIVIGVLLLHLGKGFHLLVKGKASLLALVAAFLYSLALIIDKFVINYITPINYAFLLYMAMFVFLFIFSAFERNLADVGGFIRNSWKPVILLAVLAFTGSFFIFTSISLANVTTIAPVLRLEVLFSVIAGGMFFKERNILIKLLGAFLLFAGIALIIA